MKKALMGGRCQNWSIFSYNKIFCPHLFCYTQGAKFCIMGQTFFAPYRHNSAPGENISDPLKNIIYP